MVADLRKVMKLNRHHSLLKSGRLEDSLREHRAIMDALAQARRQGDREADAGAFQATGSKRQPERRALPGLPRTASRSKKARRVFND